MEFPLDLLEMQMAMAACYIFLLKCQALKKWGSKFCLVIYIGKCAGIFANQVVKWCSGSVKTADFQGVGV